MRYLLGFIFVLALSVMGCSEGSTPTDPSIYASKDLWLCRPDIENDRCDTADLSVTEIRPDGTLEELDEVAPNPNAEVDCFFIYHTVNHAPEPENTEILSPADPAVIEPVFKIAAHYRGSCRVFAPLYHQMSLITYTEYWPYWEDSEFFQRAYADVVEAFEYYMRAHNNGRDIVLLGHSQGSHMLTKLVEDKFDNDETLRGQLVSAVLMGPGGYLQVTQGERLGGSYENIPLCSSASETGCVVVFDANAATGPTTYEAAVPVYPPMERACVNPASVEGGAGTLAAFMYPRTYEEAIPFPDEVETAWVLYPELYTSACSAERGFAHVLEIAVSSEYQGEVPITPQELQDALVRVRGFTNTNLHGAEYFIANKDLVRIVEQQIASRRN